MFVGRKRQKRNGKRMGSEIMMGEVENAQDVCQSFRGKYAYHLD